MALRTGCDVCLEVEVVCCEYSRQVLRHCRPSAHLPEMSEAPPQVCSSAWNWFQFAFNMSETAYSSKQSVKDENDLTLIPRTTMDTLAHLRQQPHSSKAYWPLSQHVGGSGHWGRMILDILWWWWPGRYFRVVMNMVLIAAVIIKLSMNMNTGLSHSMLEC